MLSPDGFESYLKELEKENPRLKKLVANLSPDNDILREATIEYGVYK